MAEMVGSMVAGEVVNRTSSFLISKHRERLTTREGIERLEMAHIKMEAALEVFSRWQVTDMSLLLWRRKLRRAADDCDVALHRWKLRELEEEAARERLALAPFPRRVAVAVLSFISALLVLARGSDESSRACAAVQRFERLANGAAEFLRYVEFSSPRKCSLFSPVVRKLGKHVNCDMLQQGARHSFLRVRSESPAEGWVESKPCYAYENRRASGEKMLPV
ncbi:uncharacterized protein LOC133914277 [Phragmites australis]|uniref:uncharacterized protein LOC133914277 n=1 Tax=Phragmites australis TaxID=29695 RepID=UPI002D78E834|nr:uncharacterized protein LOC133914277 [Phragmites australis]